MKTRMTIFASLLLASFAFTGCDDDNDDNYTPDEKIVNVLQEKYPNAQRVEWELKYDHYVADFYLDNIEKEAWINTKGEWVMTESDILFNDLPQAIQTSFNESEYKDWRIDDVDMLERVELETVYVIEVEKGKQEFDLHYAEDGTLVKTIEDTDNDDNHHPVTVPEVLKTAINTQYPGAVILEIEVEKGITEIDIKHENIVKEVHFNSSNEWLYTSWDVKRKDVPANVMSTIIRDYATYEIDDIDYKESADGSKLYIFELEQGNDEIHVKIDTEGNVVK
ncbi:PepSY-like domain-containing protein [Butyricimonas paravirosa]|uniref:PepSY-like domain-containing protein n=1 Tax=Butyricimonas paravirosa TaxID=1472417 RepID=UPI00210B4007|nr:PepSY-like domain-containing protein [Butyricimonas paravirosa]MCQ4874445.1 PepSY-like domain-containing protein [Butyricimonas paravirosa]